MTRVHVGRRDHGKGHGCTPWIGYRAPYLSCALRPQGRRQDRDEKNARQAFETNAPVVYAIPWHPSLPIVGFSLNCKKEVRPQQTSHPSSFEALGSIRVAPTFSRRVRIHVFASRTLQSAIHFGEARGISSTVDQQNSSATLVPGPQAPRLARPRCQSASGLPPPIRRCERWSRAVRRIAPSSEPLPPPHAPCHRLQWA